MNQKEPALVLYMVQDMGRDKWRGQYVGHYIEAVRHSNIPARAESGKYALHQKMTKQASNPDVIQQYLIEAFTRKEAISKAKFLKESWIFKNPPVTEMVETGAITKSEYGIG